MKKNTSFLLWTSPGSKIKIIDKELLAKWPKYKNKVLIVSVVKKQGRMIYFQFNENGQQCGRMRIFNNPLVQIISEPKQANKKTLSQFIVSNKYSAKQPTKVTVNTNGRKSTFTILSGFFEQNPKNIYLKRLTNNWGARMRVPGSSIVEESK